MYSQNADKGYKRMTRTVDLTGVAASQPADLSFWTSYNTELEWDHVFVEAHTRADGGQRTTGRRFRTQNGHTTDDTGASCPEAGRMSSTPSSATTQTLDPNANEDNGSARPPAPPVRGTRRAATRAAGRTGRST